MKPCYRCGVRPRAKKSYCDECARTMHSEYYENNVGKGSGIYVLTINGEKSPLLFHLRDRQSKERRHREEVKRKLVLRELQKELRTSL